MKLFIYSQIIKEKDKNLVKDFITKAVEMGLEIGVYSMVKEALIELTEVAKTFKVVYDSREFRNFMPDMVITLGGDGTILNAATLIKDTEVPIAGINMGRLGFLSNIEKGKMINALEDVVAGNFKIQKRSMIQIDSNIPIFDEPFALNDFTLHKRDTSSMITIHTYVDGKFLNSYWADGLIVSTPTGSTGYSLACGGPIVFPGSGNFVLTPVAPHNLNVRPLVLSDNSEISFQIDGRSENFLCTLDSRYETITHEHRISLKKCDFTINMALIEDIDFMMTIREKLMWGLDKRN